MLNDFDTLLTTVGLNVGVIGSTTHRGRSNDALHHIACRDDELNSEIVVSGSPLELSRFAHNIINAIRPFLPATALCCAMCGDEVRLIPTSIVADDGVDEIVDCCPDCHEVVR